MHQGKNNIIVDDTQEIDKVMLMYNLIEYSYNDSRTSSFLWQCYTQEAYATLTNSESFKSKVKATEKTLDDDNTKDVKAAVPLKY